ncbi:MULTISPECIES: winged helix-turn-helix domain-containing protein [Haloferax]|uniref:Sugar-specific transcriptional regulator TrmB n=1 Tax=Haloferax volcanii TaxID=2246 RepID=A0A847TYH6_HALVO|nr:MULTISPECIES: winged helix-turn-helix domain-containing protein [Haloferax]NLV03604.1 sugar-specific transcriptional regulator TrmB [Haloferax alexandrinus]RDZ35302.1 sugar-specific transcriptional regulator TrmB [Haloferax sp. Atlit-24N]RLM35712.1 ArsR family transcriptional regulator [Haloferax sp. Atlit-109R]RLM43561.1 ArsR family transcriptional regulator [Haloferax sp. Atlit-105R]
MTGFDPSPDSASAQRRWQEGTDTFDRVYDVALGVTSPTAYTDIAELADCSPNAAKKHLERLAEMGIVQADRDSRPAQYERNEGYLEWQDASRIANELSVEEIIERVKALEERRREYETQFESTDPKEVSVFDYGDHDTIHDRMTAVSEWQGVIRDIRLYELARQLSQNDGHLIPA